LLVSPKRHVGDISDLTLEERADLMDMIVKAKDVLTRSLSPNGFNIGFNLGAVAGAGLAEHIHAHIVPRWSGDTNFMPVLGDVRVVPEALDATWELLRGAWEES
jgi:ATP adenylyltransferase